MRSYYAAEIERHEAKADALEKRGLYATACIHRDAAERWRNKQRLAEESIRDDTPATQPGEGETA